MSQEGLVDSWLLTGVVDWGKSTVLVRRARNMDGVVDNLARFPANANMVLRTEISSRTEYEAESRWVPGAQAC